MIKIKSILTVFLLTTVGIASAHGASEDEQWPIPNEYAFGHHSVLIQDNDANGTAFSLLTMWDGANSYICKSINDVHCSKAMGGNFRAVLPMCESENDFDCIVSLTAIDEAGKSYEGKFVEYVYGNKHPNQFIGDGKYTTIHASEPSIWNLRGAEHDFGSEYGLMVSVANVIQIGRDTSSESSFSINLFPISRMKTEYSLPDVNGYSNYPKCIENKSTPGMSSVGCGGGAQEFGRYRCALKMIENATCLLQHAFPKNLRFRVVARLGKQPSALMHGRLKDPSIAISASQNSTTVSVEAGSVRVPILSSGGDFNSLTPDLQNYWNNCIGSGACRGSSRQATGNVWTDPLKRNIQDYAQPYGARSLELVSIFAKSVKDTSVAAPSAWNIRTLGPDQMQTAAQCFKSGQGFLGVVTTNSTTYSEGPPSFKDGALSYKVASLHYLPSGEVFKGNYNLVLRSDVARCLYGFSRAPISATIEVLSADGSAQVATTVVNERSGWLYMSANGFSFSSPTVKVILTQDGAVLPQETKKESVVVSKSREKISVTCIKGKSVKKVTAVNPKCPTGYKKK